MTIETVLGPGEGDSSVNGRRSLEKGERSDQCLLYSVTTFILSGGGGGPAMSSTLSYYTSKNRASDRLDNKRNEISRSSAYILDSSTSNRSSYSSYGSNAATSYGDSRAGRSSYRDRSTDFSARTR